MCHYMQYLKMEPELNFLILELTFNFGKDEIWYSFTLGALIH